MINFMIVDAGIELVPTKIARHPAIIKSARRKRKKPEEVLLDISLHYPAMKKLGDFEKRGRPDIVHFLLLLLLDSVLNKHRRLGIYVYTIGKKIIRISPETRLPRNYNRFVGLMEQLLVQGCVPPDSKRPLLEILDFSLYDFVKKRGFSKIYLLDEKGEQILASNLSKRVVYDKNPLIMVGGFQRGEFSSEVRNIADYTYSIYKEPLQAWCVLCKLLIVIEEELGIW